MAADSKADAALALHRFGFGPAGEGLPSVANDPRGALLADLDTPGRGQIAAGNLPNSADTARRIFDFRAERQAEQKLEQRAKKMASEAMAQDSATNNAAGGDAIVAPKNTPRPNEPPPLPRQIFLDEAKARIDAALYADTGFVERLVWFWSN